MHWQTCRAHCSKSMRSALLWEMQFSSYGYELSKLKIQPKERISSSNKKLDSSTNGYKQASEGTQRPRIHYIGVLTSWTFTYKNGRNGTEPGKHPKGIDCSTG